jgi:benzoate/toluate 1,2-dioxygenase alpha subunit
MVGRGRNLYVYPNAHFMDQPSTQIRVLLPIAPGLTEARVYCIAPKGESREARAARVRKFEDFYMVTGMATSDDMAALEDVQRGSAAAEARWTTIDRGLSIMQQGPDAEAKHLGAEPLTSNNNWENETLYYGFYRRWAEEMGAL